MTEHWRLQQLRQALQNLASEPADQIETLSRDGFQVSVDELGLDLGDALERLQGSHALAYESAAAVRELHDLIKQMSGQDNSELWTREALMTAPEWKRARDLAKTAFAPTSASCRVIAVEGARLVAAELPPRGS